MSKSTRPRNEAPADEAPKPRNWRELHQKPGDKLSPTARRRRLGLLGRTLAVGAGALVFAYALFAVALYWRHNYAEAGLFASQQPLSAISFTSDGALTPSWLSEYTGLAPGANVLSLDVAAVRTHLETHGQVADAHVRLELPDRLVVELEERTPIARARVQFAGGEPVDYLVASDGTCWRGVGYAPARLQRLPWLSGVAFTRTGSGLRPLDHMGIIGELLRLAHDQIPEIAREWSRLDLSRYDGDREGSLVVVRGRQVRHLVLAPREFDRQFARLEQILAHAAEQGRGPIQYANLSLKDSVPVRFADQRPPVNP